MSQTATTPQTEMSPSEFAKWNEAITKECEAEFDRQWVHLRPRLSLEYDATTRNPDTPSDETVSWALGAGWLPDAGKAREQLLLCAKELGQQKAKIIKDALASAGEPIAFGTHCGLQVLPATTDIRPAAAGEAVQFQRITFFVDFSGFACTERSAQRHMEWERRQPN